LRQLVLLPLKTLPFGCQQTLQALSLHLAFQPIPHPMHAIQSNVLLNKRLRPLRSKSYIVSQTRMRPTTGSSVGYPEEEAFDDTEDYHDKRHADGVNTLQAQQDLSDVLYKEKWQSQTQHSEQRKAFQHLGKLGCSRTIESLVFDIRSLDRRSPEAAGGNASGLHLHQTLTLVSIVRDAADCLALDVEQKGRDYSDQVTRTPYTVFRQGAELSLTKPLS
jgi:hypothetical protein